jgi:hypothetical protein
MMQQWCGCREEEQIEVAFTVASKKKGPICRSFTETPKITNTIVKELSLVKHQTNGRF